MLVRIFISSDAGATEAERCANDRWAALANQISQVSHGRTDTSDLYYKKKIEVA